MKAPVAVLGGGPVGLTLALLLARRHVASVVFDARALDEARRDRRLLALSRGTLDTLAAVATLPASAVAPIRRVVVTSRGEFGRAVIADSDIDGRPLGATVRYGDLLTALDSACRGQALIEQRRPLTVTTLQQAPAQVAISLSDGDSFASPLAVNAEGFALPTGPAASTQWALTGDLDLDGPPSGTAIERFTRDGPLALLPLPTAAAGAARTMALVWCMPTAQADRREQLSDADFSAELQSQLGERTARVRAIRARGRYPLHERARVELREHRVVHVGNAAQTLHPVAGQGLNLGMRDCAALAEAIGQAAAAGLDPMLHLPAYERQRSLDRAAIRALTGSMPALFATRFAPVALARSVGLTLLSIVPDLRIQFARLLMFGVRS